MSMRQSRDELIKRGVLKEIFEKGELVFWKLPPILETRFSKAPVTRAALELIPLIRAL